MRICKMAYGDDVPTTSSGRIDCGGCPLMDMNCEVKTALEAIQVLTEIDVKITDMTRNIYLQTIGG